MGLSERFVLISVLALCLRGTHSHQVAPTRNLHNEVDHTGRAVHKRLVAVADVLRRDAQFAHRTCHGEMGSNASPILDSTWHWYSLSFPSVPFIAPLYAWETLATRTKEEKQRSEAAAEGARRLFSTQDNILCLFSRRVALVKRGGSQKASPSSSVGRAPGS